MPSLRIVLDPEASGGMGEPFRSAVEDGTIIHLKDEMVISGLEHGTQGGNPSMAFGFVLPDGRPVLVETTWALFRSAYHAFDARFNPDNWNREDVGDGALLATSEDVEPVHPGSNYLGDYERQMGSAADRPPLEADATPIGRDWVEYAKALEAEREGLREALMWVRGYTLAGKTPDDKRIFGVVDKALAASDADAD